MSLSQFITTRAYRIVKRCYTLTAAVRQHHDEMLNDEQTFPSHVIRPRVPFGTVPRRQLAAINVHGTWRMIGRRCTGDRRFHATVGFPLGPLAGGEYDGGNASDLLTCGCYRRSDVASGKREIGAPNDANARRLNATYTRPTRKINITRRDRQFAAGAL